MKFEEVLPLMREGKRFKCGDDGEFYTLANRRLFGMDIGPAIVSVRSDAVSERSNIFIWGIPGALLISDDWSESEEHYEENDIEEMEDILSESIEKTICNFMMAITKPFTPENAMLPPLCKPIAEEVMKTLVQFGFNKVG